MKALLILWAIGLTAGDKLDRTYLPPSGAIKAGGNHEDLDPPLEFPKENYPSTLQPVSTIYDPQRPNYPNVAIGIDRQGPVTSEYPTSGTGAPFSKNIYNIPTTGAPFSKNTFNSPTATTPYAFIQTTTLSPIGSYKTTGSGSTSQYPSTISNFAPKTTQQDVNFDGSQRFGSDFSNPTLERENENISQSFTTYPNGSINFETANIYQLQNNPSNRIPSVLGLPGYQSSRVGSLDSSNLSPQSYDRLNQPYNQYRNKMENIPSIQDSGVTNSYPVNYEEQSTTYKPYDQQVLREDVQYSTPQSSDFNDDTTRSEYSFGISATTAPSQYAEGVPSSNSKIVDRVDSRYSARPERIQADADRNAVILDYRNLLTPEGYAYSYDTSNGIHADESGTAVDGVRARGSYSYVGDDGKVYSITYTADENGFLPLGDHLPTAPPIPSAILKVIEKAEMNRRLGVSDDGSYDDSKYGHDRYQGLIGRIPQDKYKYMVRKQPSNNDGLFNSQTTSFKNQQLPENEDQRSQDTYSSDKLITSTGRPNLSYTDKQKGSYAPQENNSLLPSNIRNPNFNTFSKSYEEKDDPNYSIYGYQGKISGNENVIHTPSKTESQHFITYGSKMDGSLDSGNTAYRDDSIQTSQDGYEYIRPQKVFNQDRRNNFQPTSTNTNTQNDRGTAENENSEGMVSIPSRFSNTEATRGSYSNVQPSIHDISGPVTTTGKPYSIYDETDNSDIYQTQRPMFDNRELDTGMEMGDNGPQRTLGKDKTIYRPSTSGPYNYESPNTSNIPSTYGQYTESTTPLPSVYSPQSTLITNGEEYQTTPFGTVDSSTLRPQFSTKTPGSFQRRPSYTTASNPEERPFSEVRTSTTAPISRPASNRINGRPEFRGRPNRPGSGDNAFVQNTPQRVFTQDGPVPNFAVSNPSQNVRIPSRPNNTGSSLANVKKVNGEGFTGPKQQQRFDPERGYFY